VIIGVCGFIGSGKDTVADYLVNFHEFRRESFADTLKDAVAAVFGWDRTLLEGRTKEAREWREEVDPWWAERLGMPTLTPRWVLQYWGTEVCRKSFHDDIWIASLENKIRNSKDDIIVSDVRFPNEVKAIKNQNGKMIWVQRGRLPKWYDTALEANAGSNIAINDLKVQKVHASEWAWVGTKFDHTIHNDMKIDDLYNEVKALVVSS
jgi:hypothetical protein|tara:strand:- start:1308 stop:1928 length:621 start_codon:yes stop_codon:yes gene_type:complete